MRRVLAIAIVALAVPLVLPAHALASPSSSAAGDAQAFVSRINALREAKGLPALAVSADLTAVAERWNQRMMAGGAISHNPHLAGDVPGDWVAVGENVGRGTDVAALTQAFIASPAHYANLVDPEYGFIGVAAGWGADGRLYTTHVFMALPARASAAAGSGPAATAPSPLRMAVVLAALRDVDE